MEEKNSIKKEDLLTSQIKESASHPLVIVFSARWHSHSEIVDIISQKIDNADESINVINLDADSDEALFIRFKIGKIPSALIIKDQKMIRKVEGTFSKKTILDIIRNE